MRAEPTMGHENRKPSRGSLVAVVENLDDLKRLPRETSWVYLRENLWQNMQPSGHLGQADNLKTIFSLPRQEAPWSTSLLARTQQAHLVDILEPLSEHGLEAIPPKRRLLTRTVAAEQPNLAATADQLMAIPAAFHRLILSCRRSLDALAAVELAKSHPGLIVYATGKFGAWTQALNGFLGSPLIFTSAAEWMDAEGHMPLKTTIHFYGLPEGFKVRKLYGILGDSAMESLAPAVANEFCRKRKHEGLYIPLVSDTPDCNWLPRFRDRLAAIDIEVGGFTVVAPNKTGILRGSLPVICSEAAKTIGAANLLINQSGKWFADTSDTLAASRSLARHQVAVRGKKIAVVGRGGAGRAAVMGFVQQGARVVLINRDAEKGKSVADQLGVPFHTLDSFCPGEFDILVHCTPVGRDGQSQPFSLEGVGGATVILDFAYRAGGENATH